MIGKLVFAFVLLTSGWQLGQPTGELTGYSWAPAECHTRFYFDEWEYIDLPEPYCLPERFNLHYGSRSFLVDRETWETAVPTPWWKVDKW